MLRGTGALLQSNLKTLSRPVSQTEEPVFLHVLGSHDLLSLRLPQMSRVSYLNIKAPTERFLSVAEYRFLIVVRGYNWVTTSTFLRKS
jgi:hypothetical protein